MLCNILSSCIQQLGQEIGMSNSLVFLKLVRRYIDMGSLQAVSMKNWTVQKQKAGGQLQIQERNR